MFRAKVIRVWQMLSGRERKELRRLAVRAKDAGMRCRCKVVLGLVQGRTPSMIAQGGLCAKSRVYRVAERFIAHGLTGLADRHEDNGESKVSEFYQTELLRLIDESPQEFGYRRPTWTQELMILVLFERTDVVISVSTMSRLLKRIGIGLKRPKPIVNCPWKKSRRTRRLRAIERLVENLPAGEVVLYLDEVDMHLNPKIGLDEAGTAKAGSDTGVQREALPRWRMESQDAPADLCRRRAEEQPVVLGAFAQARHEDLLQSQTDPYHPRQLRYPRQSAGTAGIEVAGGSEVDAPLLAAILSRPQPDRTHLEGPARQCHLQPPVRDDGGTHGRSARLPGTP